MGLRPWEWKTGSGCFGEVSVTYAHLHPTTEVEIAVSMRGGEIKQTNKTKPAGDPQRAWKPVTACWVALLPAQPSCRIVSPLSIPGTRGVLWPHGAEQEANAWCWCCLYSSHTLGKWLWHIDCDESNTLWYSHTNAFPSLAWDFFPSTLILTVSSGSRSGPTERRNYQVLFSFFPTSVCQHWMSFKTTEFGGEFHVFWALWEG